MQDKLLCHLLRDGFTWIHCCSHRTQVVISQHFLCIKKVEFLIGPVNSREGSACLSYSLVKDSSKDEYMEEWVYYKPMEFQKEDMPLRQEQLQHRIRECQRTLDILTKLNKGTDIDHVLHSKIDLSSFKVSFSRCVHVGSSGHFV